METRNHSSHLGGYYRFFEFSKFGVGYQVFKDCIVNLNLSRIRKKAFRRKSFPVELLNLPNALHPDILTYIIKIKQATVLNQILRVRQDVLKQADTLGTSTTTSPFSFF